MNKGPSPQDFVALNYAGPRLKRNKTVKVRCNPVELRLLDDADKKLNNQDRARTIRHMIEHFDDIERARALCAAFDRVGLAKAELAALLAAQQTSPAVPEPAAKARGPSQ